MTMTQQSPAARLNEMITELEQINLHAQALNQEAADVLVYQCHYT
jgi:hypothetical protein